VTEPELRPRCPVCGQLTDDPPRPVPGAMRTDRTRTGHGPDTDRMLDDPRMRASLEAIALFGFWDHQETFAPLPDTVPDHSESPLIATDDD
jgi:hypothetical protein